MTKTVKWALLIAICTAGATAAHYLPYLGWALGFFSALLCDVIQQIYNTTHKEN